MIMDKNSVFVCQNQQLNLNDIELKNEKWKKVLNKKFIQKYAVLEAFEAFEARGRQHRHQMAGRSRLKR
jgi:hypothetical protein